MTLHCHVLGEWDHLDNLNERNWKKECTMPIKKISDFTKALEGGVILLSSTDGKSDLMPEMSVNYVEFPPGKVVPPHTHDRVEVYLVQSGRAKMMADDEIMEVTAGDCLMAPIGTTHAIEVLGDETFKFFAFNSPPASTCPPVNASDDVQKKFLDTSV